ncbi:MAG: nuclear transport factor 2 family protein [Terracidiphilus sp.]
MMRISSQLRGALGLVWAVLLLAPYAGAAPPQKPGIPRNQRHESRHEIDQLEERWREAMLKGDVAAMDALLGDDYMAILPNGMLQSRDQAMNHMRTGATHFTLVEFSDRKVRFYGNTALVTSRAEVAGTTPEGDLTGSFRFTRVYARDTHGAWKIVSFEASRIRDPEERGDRERK